MPALGTFPAKKRPWRLAIGKKILITDDHADAAEATGELLRCDSRFDVTVVYGGMQAVEVARTLAPDLAILDVNMPVMNGYEAAGILRSEQILIGP